MRMKKKIRQGFEKATPNVLGKVLRELPAQEAIPLPTQRQTRKYGWIREFAATAAAFALLVAVAGGAVWYFAGGGFSPAAPTDPSLEQTHPSVTDPVEPRPEVYLEDLDYVAENILYPWYLRDVVYVEPEVKTPLDHNDDVYILPKTMGSYSYEFLFDSYDGTLLAVTVVDCTNQTKEFIPETVAQAIALLNEDYEKLTANSQLIITGNSGYYAVTLIGAAEDWPAKVYYVHANTGALLLLGDEVDPGYTVGPPATDTDTGNTEDTTPPYGFIPEEFAIAMALKYAGLENANNITCVLQLHWDNAPAWYIYFDDGKYAYEITMGAYGGEILAFPTPVLLDQIPDGRISKEMAIQAALDFIGIQADQANNLTCAEDSNQYRITLEYDNTYFVFRVHAYNPTDITCEKYELSGATKEMAREYALEYLGISMENVQCLTIEETAEGFTLWIVFENVQYTVTLNPYGEFLNCEKEEVALQGDENRGDVIGWRAARDIWLDAWGMRLGDVTAFHYKFVPEDQYPARYEIFAKDPSTPACIVIATTGKRFNESEADYGAPILTVDQITEIALMDLDPQIRENYAAGAYSECYIHTLVHYVGGIRENDLQFYYEWVLNADNLWISYHIDALTGQILLTEMDAS